MLIDQTRHTQCTTDYRSLVGRVSASSADDDHHHGDNWLLGLLLHCGQTNGTARRRSGDRTSPEFLPIDHHHHHQHHPHWRAIFIVRPSPFNHGERAKRPDDIVLYSFVDRKRNSGLDFSPESTFCKSPTICTYSSS